MIFRLKSLFILIVVLAFQQTPVFAENSHEHLYALPLVSNFLRVWEEIFSLGERSQRLDRIFRTKEDLRRIVEHSAGFSRAEAEAMITDESFRNMGLKKLCETLGRGDIRVGLMTLLHIDDHRNIDKNIARALYLTMEDFRRLLLIKLPEPTVTKIFENYFEIEPIENRDVIQATVTGQFFTKANIGKLEAIAANARAHGTNIVYLLGVGRRPLANWGLENPGDLELLIQKKMIGGFDVTGSIKESEHSGFEYDYEPELRKLFELASWHELPLRIHGFEGSNSGSFYVALERIMKTFNRPLELHIGHINMIDDHWIEVFKSNRAIKISIDENIASNQFLQESATASHLSEVIRKVEAAGIETHIGSDGRGILDHSSYIEQRGIWLQLHNPRFFGDCGNSILL